MGLAWAHSWSAALGVPLTSPIRRCAVDGLCSLRVTPGRPRSRLVQAMALNEGC